MIMIMKEIMGDGSTLGFHGLCMQEENEPMGRCSIGSNKTHGLIGPPYNSFDFLEMLSLLGHK